MAESTHNLMDTDRKRRLITRLAEVVIAHADELTALDAAIGDGDHGHNMKRGFEAVLQETETLSAMALPGLLRAIGMKLLSKVGGASGPLYGTLFMTLGKQMPAAPLRGGIADALQGAVEAVKARGKSDVGQKTMLDVLAPACAAFATGNSLSSVAETARRAAEATVPMRATRGRASFLGERSIGHMDPGARSAELMIAAVCEEFGGT